MLPDEILSEILSPALKVPDDLFSHTSDVSPFATYAPSTSAYLLVCKDWLRVATPLLYSVVVLRSKAQANALEKVFRKNPGFGRFVRKLRVEGGYGSAMHTILQATPNVTHLFLSLAIWSSDTTTGLCKGLPLIQPKHVITVDPSDKPLKNRSLDQLTKVLFSCIRTEWKNMETFGFPYGNDVKLFNPREVQAEALARVLTQSSTLHTVTTAKTLDCVPQFIHTLCDSSTLKTIQFTQPLRSFHAERVNSNPKLKSLVHYADTEKASINNCTAAPDFAREILPSLNPSFVPLKSASNATRDLIWRNVLFFAMYVEELRDRAFPRRPTDSHPSRLPILQVSKYFHQLGLPYLYDSLNLTYISIPQIAKKLRECPGLGSNIRVVFTSMHVPDHTMHTILSHARNLQLLRSRYLGESACVMSVDNFSNLADTAGSSLRELHLILRDVPLSSNLFTKFTALRTLELRYSVSISRRATLLALTPTTTTTVMESLHTLRFYGMRSFVVQSFIPMRLDALHTVAMPDYMEDTSMFFRFLEAHGSHLLHIVLPNNLDQGIDARALDFCPNLQVLEFHRSIQHSQISLDTPHPSLNKIIARELIADDKNDFALDNEMLPALREIHLIRFQWPATEREINKSQNVVIAESLLQLGIKVMDSSKRHWIPRVKSSRARKG
ncbi:F-box domain-containing protein [Favolaschia claudopus]|uniref:F-box domain-containing protein n=1 Tax=Favolaschia claudopus TaxID=2862362 RepID=A0AAW0BDA9_9AGAR